MDDVTSDSPNLATALTDAGRLIAGRYQVRARLGRGAWKEVYLAYDERLDREVALAIVFGAGSGEAARARITREAQVTGRLGDHPNVITVYDTGEVDGVPYLVLRAMAGGSLADAPRPAIAETIRLGREIATALAHAHAHGVVHRDVKPDNVWLAADGSAALGDFGVAYDVDGDRLTAEGAVVGTARYLSPEQARGDAVGPPSDLYALGVTLYELLTGSPPFHGNDIAGLIAQHLAATPLPPSHHQPAIPPALDALVLELLAKDPAARPPSAAAVADALGAIEVTAPSDAPRAVAGSFGATAGLPVSLTSLIGREQDLDAIVAMIRRTDVRLLTLTGTGGIGKTRLALELARTAQGDFSDGACFLSLASISDPDLVLVALVQQLGHRPLAGEEPLQTAQRLLRTRHALLVLDNFEHVLPAAEGIARLLSTCSDLMVVITSREPLRISAEHVYEVPPLSLPPAAENAEVRSLERSAAVVLFTDRASALDPGFRLTAGNRHAVGGICVKLDGLPLAIELAAGRTALLGPHELLRRLEHTLSLLTSGVRDAEPRHRALRATIDWSHDLLDEREQAAFCALGVFAGGATLRAAEAVTGATLETIDSLVAKNLVARRRSPDGAPRLLLLETIREYALERLAARPDADVVRRRHCEYFVALAETGARELWGPQQMAWFGAFDEESDNFRAAVGWSLAAGAAQLGLRLATAAMEQWGHRRRPQEVGNWIRSTLDAAPEVDGGLRGRALLGIALGMDVGAAAAAYACEALPLVRAEGDARAMCWCLEILALVEGPGQAEARALAAQALDLARRADDPGALVIALETNVLAAGSFADARPFFEEAACVLRRMGDRLVTAALLSNVGWRAMEAGEEDFAVRVLDESIGLARQTGDLTGLPYALSNRGLLALLQDQVDAAHDLFRETLQRCRDLGLAPPVWEALRGLGIIAARDGRLERAGMLCGASAAIRGDEQLSLPEQRLHDRHIEPLRSAGSDPRWAEAWNRGAGLDWDQAVASGLDDHMWPPSRASAAGSGHGA